MRGEARASAALALIVVIAACDDGTTRTAGSTAVSSTTVSSTTVSSTTVRSAASPPTSAEAGDACEATAGPVDAASTVTLGPAAGIPASTAGGESLIISGTVYDDHCVAIEGVVIHVWQTDADGVYGPGHATDELQCCYLQGTVRTDQRGRYQLVTVVPGHYAGQEPPPPAHIHVDARAPSGASLMAEIVFDDDPYLTSPDLDGYVVVTLTPASESDPTRRGVADLVLD